MVLYVIHRVRAMPVFFHSRILLHFPLKAFRLKGKGLNLEPGAKQETTAPGLVTGGSWANAKLPGITTPNSSVSRESLTGAAQYDRASHCPEPSCGHTDASCVKRLDVGHEDAWHRLSRGEGARRQLAVMLGSVSGCNGALIVASARCRQSYAANLQAAWRR